MVRPSFSFSSECTGNQDRKAVLKRIETLNEAQALAKGICVLNSLMHSNTTRHRSITIDWLALKLGAPPEYNL